MNQHLVTLRRRRNALATLHQLPVELITKILLFVRDSTEYYKRLRSLGSVAVLWKSIIERTPDFWTICNLSESPKETGRAIHKSRNLPLEIVEWPFGLSLAPRLSVATFMEFVGPQRLRWLTAEIAIRTEADRSVVLGAIQSPMPVLESLVLHDIFSSPSTPMVDFQVGNTPRLRHISLTGINIRDWDSPVFKGLRTLRLDGTRASSPSLSQMMNILRSSPQLEDLRLSRSPEAAILSTTSSSEDARNATGAAVEELIGLPKLRSIDLHQFPEDTVTAILAAIDAPICGRLRLNIPEGRPTDPQPAPFHIGLGPALGPFVPALKSFLHGTGDIQVHMGSTHLHCHNRPSPNAPGSFDIFIGTPHPLPLARWCHDILRGLAPISISLRQEFDFADEEYARVFWGFDAVTDLMLDEEVHSVEAFFTHLSEPSESHGVLHWPFPHLRTLRIEPDGFDHVTVLRMVESRYGRNQADGRAGLEQVLPLPFEKLSFWRLDDTVYQAVQLIVGPECVDRSGTQDEDDEMGEAEDPEAEIAESDEEGSDAMEEDP